MFVTSKADSKLAVLKPNDEVLIMLPDKTYTLLSSWQGPFTVIKSCSPLNYIVDVRGNHKLFYINMLKQYYSRPEDQVEENSTSESFGVRHANTVSVIDNGDGDTTDDDFTQLIPCPVL